MRSTWRGGGLGQRVSDAIDCDFELLGHQLRFYTFRLSTSISDFYAIIFDITCLGYQLQMRSTWRYGVGSTPNLPTRIIPTKIR